MGQQGAKGKPRTPGSGRKKGTTNKLNAEVKDMIRQALDDEGGVEYLRECAREHRPAFLSLVSKLVPTQLHAEVSLPRVILRNYTGVEWEGKARALPEARVVDHEDQLN